LTKRINQTKKLIESRRKIDPKDQAED
jgi:hypothetical protein